MKAPTKVLFCLLASLPAAHAASVKLGDLSGTSGTNSIDIQSVRDDPSQVAGGEGSITIGAYNVAETDFNTAIGAYNQATGIFSYALGYVNTVYNNDQSYGGPSMAFGAYNQATGNRTFAFGEANNVNAFRSMVFGRAITNNVSNSLMIGVDDTAKITILLSGNVGIGPGTTNPTQTLDVGGNIRLTGNIIKAGTGGGTLTLPSGSGTLVATTGNQVIVGTTTLGGSSAAQQVKIDGTTGNVGLGTSSTTNKLTVAGGAAIDSTGTKTAPTNGLYVEGNVGIGITTAAPAAKLDVNGTVQIAGDIKVKNHAVMRVSPAGDVGMGSFGTGANPAN